MPELPEVETVVRLIRPRLLGRRFESANVTWKRTLGGLTVRAFESHVVGARVVRVWRRAKFIVVDLERGKLPAGALVGHLRMTGRMHVEAADYEPGPYLKVSLGLDDGRTFHFIDVRKFARLTWVADTATILDELGPEPLGDEFTSQSFFEGLRVRRRAIKTLLLDQCFVAGLGNIYVDEALHQAGIHPLTRTDRLTRPRTECLWSAIRATLAEAIEREGSSFDVFYRTPEGHPGSYQDRFQVYGRKGEPCYRCGTRVTRIVVGHRGTHFCSRCQRRTSRDP